MMKKNAASRQESGQVLVIMALALVALLGFTALVVDGGTIFSDRRYDQNAADASAMAGALAAAQVFETNQLYHEAFDCDHPTGALTQAKTQAVHAAIDRAKDNNFTITNDISTQHGVNLICGEINHGSYVEKFLDVEVYISSDIQTAFAHLFFPGNIRNTVKAVARVRPRTPGAFGYAIAALDPNCTANYDNLMMVGSSEVKVVGSGMYSNSCLRLDNNVQIKTDDKIVFIDGWNNPTKPKVTPFPQDQNERIPEFTVDPVDCAPLKASNDAGAFNHKKNETEVSPGYYSSFSVSGGTVHMKNGIYCVNGDVDLTGGTVEGSEVMFYIINGGFKSTGNAQIQIQAPHSGDWKGMLIYLAYGNTSGIKLLGTSDSHYTGTVFAPDSHCDIGGTNNNLGNFDSQVIAKTVKVHGNVKMTIEYGGSIHYTLPAYIDLYR